MMNADFIDDYYFFAKRHWIFISILQILKHISKHTTFMRTITICMSYVVLIWVVAQVHSFFNLILLKVSLQDKQQTYVWNNVFKEQNSKRVKRFICNLFKCVKYLNALLLTFEDCTWRIYKCKLIRQSYRNLTYFLMECIDI